MQPLLNVPLFISACVALLGCVGNDNEFYRQPYGSNYDGNAAFGAPQYYSNRSHGHLYN